MFMKILHFAVFYASGKVRNYLYSQEIDPQTIHLNDFKFMERMMFIITNLLSIKPRIGIHQFFKYGFAEQKMMMCVDVIQRVKAMHKSIRIEQSLNSSRRITVRSSRSASPVRMNQNTLSVKHQTLAEIQEDMKSDFQTSQQKEAHSALSKPVKRTRKESLECSMRLTGSLSYQTVNRHRHPQHNMEIENN